MDEGALKDRIKEHIPGQLEVAPTEDKTRENRLGWFGHVQRISIDAPIRRDQKLVKGADGIRARPKGSWIEGVTKDMIFTNVSADILNIAEWKKRISNSRPKIVG